ncbi:MAG: hypothetical protein GSR84_03465 [Desulfurococcales archaeon]|nr:hypothetical protein [Desulfurococcales archaeon]
MKPTTDNLYWEERRFIERKLRAWLNGEYKKSRRAWLGIRLTPTLKEIYDRAPDDVKQAARRALEAVLISWFLGESTVAYNKPSHATHVFIINVNINENSNNVDVEVNIDLASVIRELRRFENILRSSPYVGPIARRTLENVIRQLEKGLTN